MLLLLPLLLAMVCAGDAYYARRSAMDDLERMRTRYINPQQAVPAELYRPEPYGQELYAVPQWEPEQPDEYENYEYEPVYRHAYQDYAPPQDYGDVVSGYVLRQQPPPEEVEVQRRSRPSNRMVPLDTLRFMPHFQAEMQPLPEVQPLAESTRAPAVQTTNAPITPQKQQQRGQKEEPLFRPPASWRPPNSTHDLHKKAPIPVLKDMIQGKLRDPLLEELSELKQGSRH